MKLTDINGRRTTATALVALVLAGFAGATQASARQDPGEAHRDPYAHLTPGRCPMERIGSQLVRCDNLTGAGVAAPLGVPEVLASAREPQLTTTGTTGTRRAAIIYGSTLFATWGTVTNGNSSANAAEQRKELTGGHAGSANAAEAPAFPAVGR